jgi:hypothetical protein
MPPSFPATPSHQAIRFWASSTIPSRQISIEAAQLGVIDIGDPEIETAAIIADRIMSTPTG